MQEVNRVLIEGIRDVRVSMIPVGAHLITQRKAYSHHGIYMGDKKVIHYSGLARGNMSGPVEITNFDAFINGQKWDIRIHKNARYNGVDVVRRALSRLGESRYHPLVNNCEHFCEWCINDEAISRQTGYLWNALQHVELGSLDDALGSAAKLAALGVLHHYWWNKV